MTKTLSILALVLLAVPSYGQQFLHNPWKLDLSGGIHTSFLGDDPREPSWSEFLIVPYRLQNSSSHPEPTKRGNQGYLIQFGPTITFGATHENGLFLGVDARYSSTIDPKPGWIYYGLSNDEFYLAEKISYSLWHTNIAIGYNLLREKWNNRRKSNLNLIAGIGITGGVKHRGYHYKTDPFFRDTASAYEQFTVNYSGWNWVLGLKYRWYANPTQEGLGFGIDLVRNAHRLRGTSMTRTSFFLNGSEQLESLTLRDQQYELDGRENDNPNDSNSPMHLNTEKNTPWEWTFQFVVSYRF